MKFPAVLHPWLYLVSSIFSILVTGVSTYNNTIGPNITFLIELLGIVMTN